MNKSRSLSLNALRTFVSVVDYDGFTPAARSLGLTQPTVSQHIKLLESQTGQQLFDRSSRPLSLSSSGESLLEYARRIVDLNDEALSALGKSEVTGSLKIGLPHEFTFSLLPRLMGSFAQIHPGVVVEVECRLSRDLLAHREDFDLTLALHRKGEVEDGTLLREEPLCWAAGADYRWAPESALLVAAAPMPCIYRQVMHKVLQGHPPGWAVFLSSVSYGAVCGAVAAGTGVTLLARSVVPENLVATVLPELPELETLELRMHPKAGSHPAALKTLESFVQDRVAEPIPPAPSI